MPRSISSRATVSGGAMRQIAAIDPTEINIQYLSPGQKGIPVSTGSDPQDIYETDFAPGERNLFRQAPQKRLDVSFRKSFHATERVTLQYAFNIFNVTNTTSLDIPVDNVTQNQGFNNEPFYAGSTAAVTPTGCGTSAAAPGVTGVYNCPTGLGIVKHAIGSPRQIQMSLGLAF